ncbi:MAG: ADOP family duplicated permease [Candidatus Acidiferrales bacterium]
MRLWSKSSGWRKKRTAQEEDLERELLAHLELEAAEQEAAGVPREEARSAAHRALGNSTLVQEEVRAAWGWGSVDALFQDLRFGLRQLRKSPGFTIVAILTLALGIGANTAIFTLLQAVMLRNLPVTNPEELYSLGDGQDCCVNSGLQENVTLFSHSLYQQIQDNTPEFSELAAFQSHPSTISVKRGGSSGRVEPYLGEFVSGNYFSMFGVPALAGRVFAASDDQPNSPATAVMSYRLWQQHYGLDPSVIGATFILNGAPATIIGVAPPSFFGDALRPDPPDFWIPLSAEPLLNRDSSILNHPDLFWLYAIGRLREGVRPGQVQAHVTAEIVQWFGEQGFLNAEERKQIDKQKVAVLPAGGGVARIRADYSDGLKLLMVVSGLVLLIACANIANLLLARGTANRLQMAVRVALGASRARLVRQLMTEGVLLAALGGVAGLFLAYAGTQAILLLAFRGSNFVPIDPSPSGLVMAFALVVSLLTGVTFSVAPAWIASHAHPAEPLRGSGRSTQEHSTFPQKSLVVLQAALSLVLLVGAGLLTQSLRNLEHQPYGFQTRGRLMVDVDLMTLPGATPQRLQVLYREFGQRLAEIPGVLSASYSLYSPMTGNNWGAGISIEGRPPAADPGHRDHASWERVSPRYFETIGTRLLRGRVIGEQDTPSSTRVAVINETFARKYFPEGDAIGKHFGFGDASHSGDLEIVGIVEDAKYQDAKVPPFATFFLPFFQDVPYTVSELANMQIRSNFIRGIQLRYTGRAADIQPAVRRTLAEIDPNLAVIEILGFDEQISRNFNGERLIASLTTLYGLLALVLASVGLYGVAAYTVARRTSEIGIRMALGAQRGAIIAMVLRNAMLPIAIGLLIGIPVALAGGTAIASQLYGVKGSDPFILLGALLVLALCAALAAVIPARRAASIDPMRALRTE